jgi:hypothetical protein
MTEIVYETTHGIDVWGFYEAWEEIKKVQKF